MNPKARCALMAWIWLGITVVLGLLTPIVGTWQGAPFAALVIAHVYIVAQLVMQYTDKSRKP